MRYWLNYWIDRLSDTPSWQCERLDGDWSLRLTYSEATGLAENKNYGTGSIVYNPKRSDAVEKNKVTEYHYDDIARAENESDRTTSTS